MRLLGMVVTVAAAALLAGCGHSAIPQDKPAAAPVPVALTETHGTPAAASSTAAPPLAPSDAAALPPGVPAPPAGTAQLVTVAAAGPHARTATLSVWERSGAGWTRVLGPVTVKVGIAGVAPTHEGMNRTPTGLFPIPSAFGRLPNPGTRLPYRQVDNADWWVSDPNSPAYNTYQRCAPGTCRFDEKDGEDLGASGPSYDYAAVIGYNIAPVTPGAGSAFFLHVDAGIPSQGCVETPRASVVALLRRLDPARNPMIAIGYF
jgi:L,D-peptidoglycan transpeptidase YkuD (ErfK/YbiS/YcfS/YnhG family)